MSESDLNYLRQLFEDKEFEDLSVNTVPELKKLIDDWLPRREVSIEILKDIKEAVEESYQKRTWAKVAGASAATVGSTLAIVGFGLGFATLGASNVLTIVGGVIGGAGAITMGGADFGDFLVARAKKNDAKNVIDRDRKWSQDIRKKAQQLNNQIDSVHSRHPEIQKENILQYATVVMKDKLSIAAMGGKFVYDSYKLLDATFDIVRVGSQLGRSTARTAFETLGAAAKGLRIAGCVFDVIGIPFDITVIIKGAYDIHKYNSGNGSNSNVANEIGKMIEELESHAKDLMTFRDSVSVKLA